MTQRDPQKEELTAEELEAEDAAALPDREAMSLVSTDPVFLGPPVYVGGGESLDPGHTLPVEPPQTS